MIADAVLAMGTGVVWSDQREPFHRSATTRPKSPPSELTTYDPTAVHDVDAVHDTPDSPP
jgi:hypothetical protein